MKKTFFLTIIYLLSTQLFGQKLDSCKFNNVLGENEYTFYKINDKLDLYKLPIREGLYLCALYYKDSAVFETMRVTKYNDDAIGNRFNENEFINYVNHLRDSIGETSLIRSNDSCVSCIDELFSKLEKSEIRPSTLLLFHSKKKNKKYGQVFVTVSTNGINSLNPYFSDIISPVKDKVLNKNNKHFVLFHKEFENKVLIIFRVFK